MLKVKIAHFLENNGLFVTFILGSLASPLPDLISSSFPDIATWILFSLFIIGVIATFMLSLPRMNKRQIKSWSVFSVAFALLLAWRLGASKPADIEILSPQQNDTISIVSANQHIEIQGRISNELLPYIRSKALNIYVFKIDKTGQYHMESTEAANVNQSTREWRKTLGFQCDDTFALLAIVAPTPDAAKDLAALKKIYFSNIPAFSVQCKEQNSRN